MLKVNVKPENLEAFKRFCAQVGSTPPNMVNHYIAHTVGAGHGHFPFFTFLRHQDLDHVYAQNPEDGAVYNFASFFKLVNGWGAGDPNKVVDKVSRIFDIVINETNENMWDDMSKKEIREMTSFLLDFMRAFNELRPCPTLSTTEN